ncbi:NAD(+)/NADH kinase [Virgisporangium ochraceum]|nr:NAD(+)/NADH kinase [Virgisporangium ochraceum]
MVHVVGIVLHPRRDCTPAVDTILAWAKERDVTVLGLSDEIGRIDCSAVAVSSEELVDRSHLLVSLGGDGTMLRALRLVEGRKTPVLGVNVGRLGFLAEVDANHLTDALSAIDAHRYTVEPRMAVRTTLPDGTDVTSFNDIALVRSPGNGLAAVSITVEGHSFVRYAADAVIVSTPTGSTAYSFSAGGPIVSPTVQGLLVSAAAAHSSFNRSLLLSLDEHLALDVLPSSGRLAVEADGIVRGFVDAGDCVKITPLPGAAHVVRLGRTTFYERARRKLRVAGSAQVDTFDTTNVSVVDNFESSRYEVLVAGEVAGYVEYRRSVGHIEFLHTEVVQGYEGRGLAGRLATSALDDVRARGATMTTSCPFMAGYVADHPGYADLLGETPSG